MEMSLTIREGGIARIVMRNIELEFTSHPNFDWNIKDSKILI
jgi:hypothetical protein